MEHKYSSTYVQQTRGIVDVLFKKNKTTMINGEWVKKTLSPKSFVAGVVGLFCVAVCQCLTVGDETLTIYRRNVLTVGGETCALNAWCRRHVTAPIESTLHLVFKDA